MVLVKIIAGIAAAVVLAVALLVADFTWNDSRLLYMALGRDQLVDLCTPPAREALAGRGFTPTDFTIGDRLSITVASGTLGRSRVLSGPFTFSDGPDGQRVDGRLVCAVHGKTVNVKVDVEATPLRAA